MSSLVKLFGKLGIGFALIMVVVNAYAISLATYQNLRNSDGLGTKLYIRGLIAGANSTNNIALVKVFCPKAPLTPPAITDLTEVMVAEFDAPRPELFNHLMKIEMEQAVLLTLISLYPCGTTT